MSKNYTHLSFIQKYQIEANIKIGIKQKKIAQELGVSPSTICRELSRNTAKRVNTSRTYVASNAQRRTEQRHDVKPKLVKFTPELYRQAVEWLTEKKWSPELIISECKRAGKCPLSTEWLYHWICQSKHGNKTVDIPYKYIYQHLKHGKSRRKRGNRKDTRGMIHHRTSIEQRPLIVQQRMRPGDIEVDYMMGKNHKGALLVIIDRATLYTCLHKLQNRKSDAVNEAIIENLNKMDYPLHTIMFGNDKGFANHMEVAHALNVNTYFTRPYTSQDKGTVENRIVQIRRFFPKKTKLALSQMTM
jgi:IS30 family transposase